MGFGERRTVAPPHSLLLQALHRYTDESKMKDRYLDVSTLDVLALCKDAARVSGRWPLAGMERLAAGLVEVADSGAELVWEAQGLQRTRSGAVPENCLHLQARAQVKLQCQRCLQALEMDLAVDRHFLFVASEEEAARLDEHSEEDVLVLQPRLDLRELIEDELILAVPLVPRHEGDCPDPLPMSLGDLPEEAPQPNPFAALAALRTRRDDSG